MPSIVPGYLYTIFATLLIGTMIVYSCGVSSTAVKNEALSQQLLNVGEYVATQSLVLITQTTENIANITQILDIPSQIGNQLFWIRLNSDSSEAWVECGYGLNATESGQRISIPAVVTASGTFISGEGQATLNCYIDNGDLVLTLTRE